MAAHDYRKKNQYSGNRLWAALLHTDPDLFLQRLQCCCSS